MTPFKIKNEAGLELTITTDISQTNKVTPILGGNPSNPTWEEYLEGFKDEYTSHLELLKEAIKELGWVGMTGEQISNYYGFVFSDGITFTFSWRAWGDFMQAVVNKQEGYMAYYM